MLVYCLGYRGVIRLHCRRFRSGLYFYRTLLYKCKTHESSGKFYNRLYCLRIPANLNFLSCYPSQHLQASVTAMHSSPLRVDDVHEGWLQAGAANKEAIDIGLLGQLTAVLLCYTSSIKNTSLVGGFRRNFVL